MKLNLNSGAGLEKRSFRIIVNSGNRSKFLSRIPVMDNSPKTISIKRIIHNKSWIYLIIGLLLIFILISSFLSVINPFRGSLSQIDSKFSEFIESIRNPILDKMMLFFSFLGDEKVILIGLIFIIALLFYLKKNYHIIILLVSVVFGEIFIWALKNIIQRTRPISLNALTFESSFSFPSGHAFIAVAFYFLLIYFYYRESKNKIQKILFIIFGLLLVIGIGFSRVYIGVHWLTDVLVGYIFGSIWVIILINIFENKIKTNNVK